MGMVRFHAHFLVRGWRARARVVLAALLAVFSTLGVCPVAAQTPTPWPTPTPIVTNDYIVQQTVTYGDGGIIVGLLFLAGVFLLNIMVHLGERITDR